MSEADCLFCKIRDGKIPSTITYRDDDVFAFKDIGPKAPLHELVVPTAARRDAGRRHDRGRGAVRAADGDRREAREGERSGGDGFRVVMNAGAAAGQTVSTSTCTCWRDGRWPGRPAERRAGRPRRYFRYAASGMF